LHEIFKVIKTNFRLLYFLLVAFLAGCVLSGLFFYRHRFASIGELDRRYNIEYAGAAETIGRLEGQLEQEREYNRKLREYNTRARELAEGLTVSAERNVRNLQDAVSLIQEIRTKLKILEDFYTDSSPGGGSD